MQEEGLTFSLSPSASRLSISRNVVSASTLRRKKKIITATDANDVKLDEQATESRAIYIGRPIKVFSEHPAMEYYQQKWRR